MTLPNRCPECDTDQIRTRASRASGNGALRRLRRCLRCGARWTTYEIHAAELEALQSALAAVSGALRGAQPKKAQKGV